MNIGEATEKYEGWLSRHVRLLAPKKRQRSLRRYSTR
jgi:hypothetical protein